MRVTFLCRESKNVKKHFLKNCKGYFYEKRRIQREHSHCVVDLGYRDGFGYGACICGTVKSCRKLTVFNSI